MGSCPVHWVFMPRNRNAAKLAKNDTRFHWQCHGRRDGGVTEAAAYAYRRKIRVCTMCVCEYWGGPGHDFWLAINTQKYWVLSPAGYMGSPPLPPSYKLPLPISSWKLLLITGRGLKAEKWFLACGSHLTKQLMRFLNWLSLVPIYDYIQYIYKYTNLHILIISSSE